MSLPDDPDARALLYVQQYLSELGFADALKAVERKSGVLYDGDKCPTGSCLLQLVYKQLEQGLSDSCDPAAAARQQEELQLLQGGAGDYPTAPCCTVSGAHPANILAVRFLPGGRQVVTGAADGCVRCFGIPGGELLWDAQLPPGAGGVLSIAVRPLPGDAAAAAAAAADLPDPCGAGGPPTLLAVGCMGGGVHVLESGAGRVLASTQPHSKYVVGVAWSWCGRFLATASFDQSLTIQRVDGSGAGVDGSDAALSQEASPLELLLLRQIPFTCNVQDVMFLPPQHVTSCQRPSPAAGASSATHTQAAAPESSSEREPAHRPSAPCAAGPSTPGGALLLAAVRGAPCLYGYDAGTGREVSRVPLDEDGGGPVPYSVVKMALSPDGRFLLLATDGPRLLVLRATTHGWSRLRALHGLPTEQFHTPSICWARDSNYLFSNAAGAAILVFHLGSAKVVAHIAGHHTINVRDVAFDPGTNRLISCSFDKKLVVYEQAADG